MTAVLQQASNNTGLSIAREVRPSVVDGTSKWISQEPNSYKDFGGKYKMLARDPINSSRQRDKGVITDLDASGGWQEDLTYEAVQNKIEGLMYADFRRKVELPVTGVTTSNDQYAIAAGGGAVHPGDLVFAANFAVAANNGLKLVSASAATDIAVVENLADEGAGPGTLTVVGHQFAVGDLTYTAATRTLGTTAFDLTTLGLIVGEFLCVTDDTPLHDLGANLGMARVKSIAAHAIVLDKVYEVASTTGDLDEANEIVDATGAGKSARIYFGRVIKNELAGLIKHYTYQAERTLGRDDTTAAYDQAEYLTGGVFNEAMFTFNSTDKATCEWMLLAAKYETRTSAVGPKAGTRISTAESSAFNTSTDVKFLSLELVGTDVPLYAYVMDTTITVKNNAKPNKAIGVLGAINMTEGRFEVSAAATAYFSNVSASEAIKNNKDVTLAAFIARDNHGMIFDIPLISLGDGRPKITANEAIQLPLSIDAASAKHLNPASDYTMAIMFFDYLPSVVANVS